MPIRKPADREIADRQPDLFDEHGHVEADHVPAPAAPCAGPAPGQLTDGELIEMLSRADMSDAGHVCAEVVSGRLETAVPALKGIVLSRGLAAPLLPDALRAAAVALGNRGDAGAMTTLIGELARSPSAEVIEALAMISDDDVIVHLGRCAERHPALADTVVEILNDMEGARAQRLARRLEAKGRDRGPA